MLSASPAPMSTSTASITFDDSLWPLLIIRMVGTVPFDQYEEYLSTRLAYLQREEKHITLYDGSQATLIPAEHRRRQMVWMKEHEALRERFLIGSAIVTTSAISRLTLSAFFHIWPRSVPYYVTSSLGDAAGWAVGRLHECGLSAPTGLISQRFGLSFDRTG